MILILSASSDSLVASEPASKLVLIEVNSASLTSSITTFVFEPDGEDTSSVVELIFVISANPFAATPA